MAALQTEVYSHSPSVYHRVLEACLADAAQHFRDHYHLDYDDPQPVDVRLWIQKWPTSACGFAVPNEMPQVTLAPTVTIKYHRHIRYIYHNGQFAYVVQGTPSINYYDGIRMRKLPGAADIASQHNLRG